MKFGIRLALAAAALVSSLSAQAGVLRTTLTFDSVDTSTLAYGDMGFLVDGDEFYQPGLNGQPMFVAPFSNSPLAQPGDLVGALVNGACQDLLCPVNNPTTYLSMLDDGVVVFGSTDGFRFSVKSFSASFIGSGDPAAATRGAVRLQGVRGAQSTTATFTLGAPQNGFLNFSTFDTGTFGNTEFDVVYAYGFACGTSTCSAFSTNQAQFALDDIVIEHVPEPGSLALLAIAGLAAGRVTRRRAA